MRLLVLTALVGIASCAHVDKEQRNICKAAVRDFCEAQRQKYPAAVSVPDCIHEYMVAARAAELDGQECAERMAVHPGFQH